MNRILSNRQPATAASAGAAAQNVRLYRAVYGIGQEQIQTLPGGENASLNQVLLRAPGMAQDSAANAGLHLRGEHANISTSCATAAGWGSMQPNSGCD